MTDKEYRDIRKRLEFLIGKWEKLLGLQNSWAISVQLFRGGFDDRSSGNVMWTTADWQYRLASIGIDMPLALQETEERLEECIIHELMHVIIRQAMEHDGHEHEEYVCSTLAQAFLRTSKGTK